MLLIVDENIGAQLAATLQLLLRASRNRHLCAERLGYLNGKSANAAAPAMDEDALAFVKARLNAQVGPHGAPDLNHCCSFLDAQTLRHGKQLALRNRDVFGVATTGKQAAHLGAYLPVRISGIGDGACCF